MENAESMNEELPKSMEDLKLRQKEESKALLAKIQALKHSVSKGDKKKKKLVATEIALMEEELKKKHSEELVAVQECPALSEQVQTEYNIDDKPDGLKLSRAQKRRIKKEAEEKQRQQLIADAERENVNSARNVELRAFEKSLADLNLKMREVPPDGNCLFAAMAVQVCCNNGQVSDKNPVNYLRKLAADYMRSHQDDFLSFIVDPETGNVYSEDGFLRYCAEIETTCAWGGQTEIKAISQALGIPVEIYQANTPVLRLGEEFHGEPVRLSYKSSAAMRESYHRHTYGLGEHYNALLKEIETGNSSVG